MTANRFDSTHLGSVAFGRLLAGRCGEAERIRHQWHLYVCGDCRRRFKEAHGLAAEAFLGRLWNTVFGGLDPMDLGRLPAAERDRLDDLYLDLADTGTHAPQQRRQAPDLIEKLAQYPYEQQELIVRNSRMYQSYGFVEMLLEETQREWFESPKRALGLAKLSLVSLAPVQQRARKKSLADPLEAKALAFLGNAQRIKGDFEASRISLESALRILRRESVGPSIGGEVLNFRASLHYDQEQFERSLWLRRRAEALFLSTGEDQKVGATAVSRAKALGELGSRGAAVRLLKQCEREFRFSPGSRLSLCQAHILAVNLSALGRLSEARGRMEQIRETMPSSMAQLDFQRVEWLEAQLLDHEGRPDSALSKFLDVRMVFRKEGLKTDLAFLSLELAPLYLKTGNHLSALAESAHALSYFEGASHASKRARALELLKAASHGR